MDAYGLLITKGDDEAFGDWCRDQLPFYRAVVCLDGSENDATAKQAPVFSEKLIYLHEREFDIPSKGDHGLRHAVHHELINRFGPNLWIMCCHTDEFCYHDPRTIAAKAQRDGYDHVAWFSPHFYPHPSERHDLARTQRGQDSLNGGEGFVNVRACHEPHEPTTRRPDDPTRLADCTMP